MMKVKKQCLLKKYFSLNRDIMYRIVSFTFLQR